MIVTWTRTAIDNTGRGSQFTSQDFTTILHHAGTQIGMDRQQKINRKTPTPAV
ncbi:MAG: hypothetical protein AAF713_02430 [Pseudomonadota bacterium]